MKNTKNYRAGPVIRTRGVYKARLALSQDTVTSPRTEAMESPSEEPQGAAQIWDAWTQAWPAGQEAST